MKLNQTFRSYDDMIKEVNLFFEKNNHVVSITDSKKNPTTSINFQYIEWQCVHFETKQVLTGKTRSRAKMCHNPLGCKMCLRVNYEKKSNEFRVKKLVEEHIDSNGEICHITDKETYELQPSQRRLNVEEKEEVVRLKRFGCDSKKVGHDRISHNFKITKNK